MTCSSCSNLLNESSKFCSQCGTPTDSSRNDEHERSDFGSSEEPPSGFPYLRPPFPAGPQVAAGEFSGHHHVQGFSQMFGLHPISGVTTLAVNAMLFGGTVLTGGALWPVAIAVGVVMGYITYRAQKRFYDDDHDAALVKSLAIALITAIPVGLPAFLTIPSTVVGIVQTLRKK